MNVQLKRVTQADTSLIVKWRNENKEFFPEQPGFTVTSQNHWYFNKHLYDPADNYFVVMVNKRSVGTIACNARTSEIGRVLLGNKDFARTGVMSEALKQIRATFGHTWLRVLKANTGAIGFYQRNGYTVTRESYTHSDMWIMED